MTKIIIGIKILILIPFFSFGQTNNNYIEYFNLTYEGDKQIYLKNDSLALELYKKAFKKVDYIHSNKLLIAAELAIKQKEFKLVYEYSKEAVLLGQGEYNKFYNKRAFKPFRKTSYYKTFMDSLEFFKSTFIKNANVEYRNKAFSLSDYEISFKKKEHKNIRASNYLNFIIKYGYATEKDIGSVGLLTIRDLSHIYLSLSKNESYITIIEDALKKGAFLPEVYAEIYDYSKMYKNEEPYFYQYYLNIQSLSKEKKALINKRRYKWGIRPIGEKGVRTRGSSFF